METNRMQTRVRVHDGIVGLIYLVSIVLGATVDLQWLYLAGAVAVLQILSTFTGFCPVYFILNRMMPDAGSRTAGPKTS